MPSPAATIPSGPRFWLAVAVFVAVAGFIVWDAVTRGRHVLEVSASYGVAVDAPAVDPKSPTGYADGRRSLVLPGGSADTAHWIMQTQSMIATGDWRVRRVDYDNAPAGREVHWAAPFHWWLAGLAWLDHRVTGRPVGQSVERAVIYSGPLMLGIFLAGLVPFLLRRFSVLAAVFCAGGAVATFPFYLDFMAGYADHHGLANICGLLTVLFLAVGSGNDAGRRWFVASGVVGGIGLWVSAATQAPVLFGIGLGLLGAAWMARRASKPVAWVTDPGLLRVWGRVGGGVSLAAWLLEYLPGHMGMRLEVNHPLYAAAWVGAGEALRVIVVALRGGTRSVTLRDRWWGAGAMMMVAALPVVIALTAAQTFRVADPFVWRIHSLYISEFQGLGRLLGKNSGWGAVSLCLPMLILLPPLWRALRGDTPADKRAVLALVLLPALVGWVMAWGQVRWMSLAFALSVPVIAVFFGTGGAAVDRTRRSFFGWLLAALVVFGPGAMTVVQKTRGAAEFTVEDIRSLAERDVAHWLKLRGGTGPVVVAGAPTPTTKLIYFGGLDGVGTLYWENAAGLKHSAELFAAPTSSSARDIARRLELTHIVFVSWGSFEATLARLHRGLPEDAPLPPDTFAARLLSSPVPPPWLRQIPFKLPEHPALAGGEVRIWRITPEQSPVAAVAGAANCFLELGRLEEAQRLVPVLSRLEDDLLANVMLAAIASRRREARAFVPPFERVLARLDRAEGLSLEEHVFLTVVLAVGQQVGPARTQLRWCADHADEHSVRQLSSGALADLLTLGDALEVPLAPAAQRLAESLLRPDQRK